MTNALRRTRICLSCRRDRPHQGRGLCSTCYNFENRHGRLDQWPPLGRTRRAGVGSAKPLTLGTARRADPVVLDRVHRGEPVRATHPDDRAAIIATYLAGQITKNVALTAMHCSTAVFDATISTLERAA
ncbi:hypothetical protein FK268_12780 [Tsukamurella sputi]|uniref:Uncharacterized protein n=1 Tax=Tsukamurella sputi TaxID=2591848 RepID=A0A5C5RKH2_9ACTN|nr:hypothetical protein [Tsukamurella sputi]TWS23188.1 hypothetical protein FK268_12780 [Tsukamurella sputi]